MRQTCLGSVWGHRKGLFFFGTGLFSLPKGSANCWSRLIVRSQTSPRSAEVPHTTLHMFTVGLDDVDVAHVCCF